MRLLVSALIAVLSITSCDEQDVLCTMEFRMLSVKVSGDSTVRMYTVDVRNKDTIEGYEIFDSNWCFADDGEWFNRLKRDEKRTINIVALSKSGKTVKAECVITRDACHIDKVAGPQSIEYPL